MFFILAAGGAIPGLVARDHSELGRLSTCLDLVSAGGGTPLPSPAKKRKVMDALFETQTKRPAVLPECEGHYNLLKGMLGRLFMDVPHDWYLDSALAFLQDDDWCTFIWDYLEYNPDDRERLAKLVTERIKSQHPWFWHSWDRVMAKLPDKAKAILAKSRVEAEFLSANDLANRFGVVDTMRLTSTGCGLDIYGHTIVVSTSTPEMAKARAGDDWEAAIDACLAHEFGHIYLGHYWIDHICQVTNTNRDERKIILEHQNFAADLQAILWGFNLDAMGLLPKRRKDGDVV